MAQKSQPNNGMQWFGLIFFACLFVVALVAVLIVFALTKNSSVLALLIPPFLLVYPIVIHLFPTAKGMEVIHLLASLAQQWIAKK